MQNIKVGQGQWLGDVAVKESGSLESIFELSAINGICITDDLDAGHELISPTLRDQRVINYYQRNDISPATGKIDILLLHRGIGWMMIETDFIVS